MIGGAFINADGANGDYICYWNGAAFKSFYDLGATELNNSVESIDINPNGTIIIGGQFIDAGGDPEADGVAAWRGNKWVESQPKKCCYCDIAEDVLNFNTDVKKRKLTVS